MDWIWIALAALILAVLLSLSGFAAVAAFIESAFYEESAIDTAASSSLALLLFVGSAVFAFLGTVTLSIGVIGLGVRSGTLSALRSQPPP